MFSIALPADIILHIFSFLPLSDICHIIKTCPDSQHILRVYLKQALLSRAKHDKWSVILHTPPTYFAILCNRDIQTSVTPIAELTCIGYNSQADYLRFETLLNNSYQLEITDEELEFQSMRIYCAQWFNLSINENSHQGQVKLAWREGDQTKQIGDMIICYKCTKVEGSAEDCEFCKRYNRCSRHAFLSTPTKSIKKMMQINSIRVSYEWLKRGLIF